MDSFKTFMNIFERAIAERNSTNLLEILRNSKRYFQNIAKDDSELMLSILFDKNKGLFSFLNNELNRSNPQKGFDMAIKEAFHLLEFIMEQFSDIFVLYVVEAKNVCQQALVTRCSSFIQKAASNTFNTLIQVFKEFEIELGETVKKFISLFHLVDIKERSLLLSVLGTIIKYFPEIFKVQEYSIIFQQLRNDFKKQYNPQTMAHSIDTFQVYLDVFSNILVELPKEVGEKHYEELYKWVKELSHPEKYSVKKVSMRSAINLLSKHMHLFCQFVYCDYKYWYDLLINLAQNKNVQCSECGKRALRNFYNEIGNILKHKTSEDDKAIFLYFKNLFEEQLKTNHHVNSSMLRFIIYGFSQMAAPCKRYLTNSDVKNMFSLIANCAMLLCSKDSLETIHLESICDYQEALSEVILHTSGLSIDQINIITKLSILLIKRFPDLPITSQNIAISSLINTIVNVGIISKNLLHEFLYNLIYNGIMWTCSHTLFIDAELQRELNNLPEQPRCYKSYLPLWLQLLNADRYGCHRQTAQDVVDSTIYVGIILIDKLNLSTRTKEDNIFSDASFSQIAENEADFRTFVNIVDLYVDMINHLQSSLFINTMHKFLLKIITISYKHHLISGFYKLVHATFRHICDLNNDEIEAETLELLYKYLMNALNLIPTFSNELLTTCLYLILNVPMIYVERILNSTIPIFKIAFTIGISDFELACTALNALEKWSNHLNNRHITVFLQEIVPFLEPYLHSRESSVEFLQDIIKTERKDIKRIILRDDENTLERFQMRILLFIASLDTSIIINFIYKRSMDTGATWDKKDLLKYSLVFSDTELEIYFDKILPRIILLAQNSGDRRTKIIACEVLHFIVAFVLGKTSQHLISNPDRFISVYVTLCPALLNLGCDHDEAARKIFQPLMLQLMHWLSSKFMLKSSVAMHFLDLLFNGLCNDSNPCLREFSGMCLAEFTKWSIKQSSDEAINQSNIYEVIYKMTNFAVHPSASKRIAGATAFNHLYTILREDEKIISIYWLEILYSFVRSLNGCSDPSIITALDHVERVLIAKKHVLNVKQHSRRKPYEFESSTLTDAVNWLLTQCGCLDQCCRTKCMKLVVKLSEHLADCNSIKIVINNYIETQGIEALNHIILSELPKIENLSVNHILPFLRSLDCYIWLIKDNLLNVEYLFGNSNSQREVIFNCARNFIHVINRIKIENKEGDLVILSKEFEDLQTLQCKTILTVFDFIQILLNFDDNFIPDFFFNQDFFELIAKCIMCPQVLGFDVKNLEITEILPTVMENILQSIMSKNDNSLPDMVKCELSIYVQKHINDFIELDKIISGTNSCSELKQYVQGLSFLKHHNVLNQLQTCLGINELIYQPEDKVKRIFKGLVKELGELIRINIKPSVKEYLEILMEFLLMHYEFSMTKTLIELIENNTMLGPDSKKIEHGIHFLNTFKCEIFKYMLKDTEKTIKILNDILQKNSSLFFMIIEQLFLFVQRHKKEFYNSIEILVDTVVKKFTTFENAINNVEDRKQKLINIFGIAVHLKHKPIELLSINKDFYIWILNQLMENSDIEYKIHILQNFLICLTDMTSDTKPELLAILRSLKNNRLDVCPNDFSQKNVKALKITNCFQKLIALLPVTKSVIVFESVISFAVGIAEYLCNEKTNEYLLKYFTSITTDYTVKSMQSVYRLFMNLNTQTNERFDVLYKFLLPSFEFCKTVEIHRFFEENIKEIHSVICQSLVGSSSDIKQLIISKIGCYNLIAIMFAKLDIRDIDDSRSVITRNAVDNVITGKELLQSLYSNALNIRMLKTPEPVLKETTRLLHCSAYNCSIAIVSNLKRDEDSYVSIFAENRKKEQLIWENIIDCQKQYNFQQTVAEYPKHRKKLINIRKTLKQKQASNHYSYIYSYDLSTCTLTEDINAYDFNETIVHNKCDNATQNESMSLIFEDDELNNHECMASICGVLNHLITEEISVMPTDNNITIPKWLKCFLSSITTTNYDNVRLFMLKVILNMQAVFQPYAKFCLQPIMHTTYLYLKRNQLNYIIVDVIELLINWQTSVFQNSNESTCDKNQNAIQKLWEIVIQKTITKTNEISKAIYKYNMNVVRTILEVWHDYLKLPSNLDETMRTAAAAAVYLILICFVNGMEKDIIERNDILVFLEKSLENWQDDEETVLQCCECYSFILKFFGIDETLSNKKSILIDKIRSILRQMQRKFENRQMKCIRALCKNYPAAAITYFEFATANIFRVDAQGKSNCLEIFLLSIPNLSTDQILEELNHMKFYDLLKNKILPCEKVALKIIDSLVFILSPSNVLSLITLVQPYTKHELSEYREITYRIFINIYKKYMADNSEDNEIKQLMYISKEILVNGVLDPTITLQEMILNFWTQDAQLANTCKERLLEVLNIFTPSIGQNFLPFTFLLILDLSKKSRNYTQKLFEPLHDCSYRDYNIALSWRTKNLGSKAPLFAPSLTSQMNQMFTQMNTISPYISSNFTRSVYDSNAEIKLRVTQELEFEPTYGKETFIGTSNNLEQHNIFKIPKVPQPAYNKRSKRFLSSASDISAAIRQKEIKKNIQHAEMIKEEVVRQRSSVKLFRKYRIGDFPDIEISHATLIEPLQQLAKNDQIICKDLIVSIICSLIGDSRQSFIEQLTNNLKRIIENEQYNTSTVTAILEISLNTNIRNCSPETIVKISRSNGLHFLGSLVLEENIINETNISIPSKKKIRSEIIDNSSCKWLQLTNLYKTMNDIDVVLSIFQNHITNEDIKIASFAQASSNWEKAKIAYEMACEMESELVKEHCFQGLFECLSNLCCWGEINTHIKNKLYKNLDNIWNDPWKDWLFPWVFEVHVRKLINEDISDEFSNDVKVMESWLEDNAKIKYVKRFFGEELSMFFLHNHLEVAREFLLNSLDEMREQWIKLHPLSMQLRIFKLQKLRTINDINLFIKILKSVQLPLSLDETLKIWNNNIPSTQDAILPWDKLISYRIYFIDSLLSDKLEQWNQNLSQNDSGNNYDEETSIIHRLHIITCNMKLKMIEASLNQKNKYIAKKYLRQLEQTIENYSTDLQNEFMFLCGKTKYLIGEIETDVKKKISNYISSWNYCHNLLQKDSLNDTINIDIRKEISKVALKIVSLSEEDEIFAELLRKNSMNLNELNLENNDLSIIRDTLENYSFNNLKACCDITTMNIGECYFNLAMYCYNRLTHGAIEAFISREFIHSILKAMSYGYLEAAHYFPCLLKPEYFNDQDTKDMFMKENESVETWLFLSWQAQLFSHLGTSIAPLIIPILKRIVDMYPNAVIYTFRLTVETNPALLNETSTYDIRQILYNKPEIDRFLIAMTYVVQPELYLQHYLTEFRKNLSLGTTTAVDILLKKVYPNALENKYDPKPGNIFNEIVVYKDKIKKLENKRIDEIKLRVDEIIKSIKESLEKRKNRSKLQYYSPWLCNFPERDIEIPGQYTGKRKPMPQYHAKILKFEPDVKVMQSLRKPIRITMIGNDAKDYHFLVKFGEDLRQDQRLQQLFTVMNKILHIDIACRQRQLSINTYQVIPLSKTVGLIQWIDNTRSLKELIHFTLSNQEIKQYNSISKIYNEWIKNAARSKNVYEAYKEATLKYNASKVLTKMNEFIGKTKWDSLRKTLTVLCPTIESFFMMRRNFITSYGTMCIAHWILGIGDRHLQNTLIIVDSGCCLGIDFGLAFDAGVDQRIPELMPFRLTSQILDLLKPFTEKDLLGTTMIYALRAMKNEQGLILSCMDVFVHEPLNWTEHVNKAFRENEDDITDIKWMPLKKIEAITKKLNGIKPSLITLDQLKEQHHDKYFDRYYIIVNGDDDIKRTRAKMKNNYLTPEEQVECLLDQATDLNILGRTFVGWEPWL
ncbi:PREDICTED: DNA-dependent protein kinase catalytic subunit-like [Eufriesea mexicana]|uniref:DNA-dependent protein kinase catalytic subunit-like n=1 Tax=Eufriesea mexicana TaxID=516756 RepID=UPI00083C0841|nr:PREDICTED: DNA-dependent protein kinase catalytic subunit-like [Eufriesea mexicana]